MCRNIRPLFNFEPPATEEEIKAAALQYVRKISGFTKPSQVNEPAFLQAIEEVAAASNKMIESLVTKSEPRNRKVEAERARERVRKRQMAK